MRRLPLRIRVLLPFVLAMAGLLAVVGLLLYLRLAATLGNDLDQGLRQRADDLATVVRQGVLPADLESASLVERGESFAQVLSPQGEVLASTPSLEGTPLVDGADLHRALAGTVQLDRSRLPGLDEPARFVATPVDRDGGTVVLVVGATKGNLLETLAVLRTELFVGGPLLLVAASLAAYVLAGAALRPVEEMRRRAERITAGEPGRLPLPVADDELSRLGSTLNAMIDRLEGAVRRERDFVADASHELRTPLALLRAELELALRHPRSHEQLQEAIASAAEETDRLIRLAEDLLVLARAQDGKLPLRLEDVAVSELLSRTVARFDAEAAAAGRRVRVEDVNGLLVRGDPDRLQQAVGCLLENALQHGRGDVDVRASQQGDRVEVHVVDRGQGFAAEFLPVAFERFSREDEARTGEGTGLGLPVVLAIAELHGGTAHVVNRDGGGADAWLSLPQR